MNGITTEALAASESSSPVEPRPGRPANVASDAAQQTLSMARKRWKGLRAAAEHLKRANHAATAEARKKFCSMRTMT